jgi:hypothetical protein
MKGSPRSLWLSWANSAANRAAGTWAGAFRAAAKRNQTNFLKALTADPKSARTAPKRARKHQAKSG